MCAVAFRRPELRIAHFCLGFLQNDRILPFIKSFSSTESAEFNHSQRKNLSFTETYLVNSCGLSPESAKTLARKVKLETLTSKLDLLKNYGFTHTQISKLVKSNPRVLIVNAEKNLLPKLEFLQSFGVERDVLGKTLSSNPAILNYSLKNVLISCYNFMRSLDLSDKEVVRAFKTNSSIFQQDLQKNAAPNLARLKELGVPNSYVSLIIGCHASIVLQNRDKFDRNVKKAVLMGFNPQRWSFLIAVEVFGSLTDSTWEKKENLLRRWGWSKDDFQTAFRMRPGFLKASESRISTVMNFLVSQMGWNSSSISRFPAVFVYSLERRVIPRCKVIKVLQLKGLIKGVLSLSTILNHTETKFLGNFVLRYLEDIPQLLDVYHGRVSLQDLDLKDPP